MGSPPFTKDLYLLIATIYVVIYQCRLLSLWDLCWSCLFIRLYFFSILPFPSPLTSTLQCCLYPGPTISVFLLGSVQPIRRARFCDIHLARGLSLKVIICDQSQAQRQSWLVVLPYAGYSSLYADRLRLCVQQDPTLKHCDDLINIRRQASTYIYGTRSYCFKFW